MDFKFDFEGVEEKGNQGINESIESFAPAKEIQYVEEKEDENISIESSLKIGNTELIKVHRVKERGEKEDTNKTKEEVEKVLQNSDLSPGVYEGGFKLWECSIDLIHYLEETSFSFEGKTVLELGCGHGLPALYALKKGASVVHFQDFNEQVIEQLTIPNVIKNFPSFPKSKTKFYSGDWESLNKWFGESEEHKYDVILTSDTLYNPAYYPRLSSIIHDHLSPKGIAFVAAKSYYFGIGGSTRQFSQIIENYPTLELTKGKLFDDGRGF
eukprot:TRINITY_DN3527_c0_g1_i8.p1 TRINITY_DN3527_c0_g1~~TRINITY_DN3527_c0_g1_i8.p1  ORF type:complete len:269 (+),score=83.13 TRINITY_DN3527_c0_g1_i8:73-879(+)